MPRLESSSAAVPSYVSTLRSLFSSQPPAPRSELVRALLLQSVRLRVTRERGAGDDEERLEGLQNGTLPLRVRPAFLVLNVVCLFILGLLGFHPNGQAYVSINDKILHFICFLLATGLFYFIWDVDEPARRVWIWRNMTLILTWLVCFAAGGLGSEMVQSLLPNKTFQWGDVVANFMGSGVGLFFSYHAERRYRSRREVERLYEPLDQELYGDEDDDDDDDERDGVGGGGSNVWKSSMPSRGVGWEAKKVRFGQDEVVNPGPSLKEDDIGDGGGSRSVLPTRKDDLFRIDDEDDDDDKGADVWREASSAK